MPLPYDPAALESEPGYISELLHQFQIQIEQCIPCIVTKYNEEDCNVSVQPLPQRAINTDEGLIYKDRPIIPSVPILRFLHGGFSINSPVFVGDTGYLIASDRSCYLAQKENSTALFSDDNQKKKNKGSFPPDDLSLGQYSSGFFLPCSWSKEGNPNGELVIEGIGKHPNDGKWQKIILSNDGSVIIEIDKRKIIIDESGIKLSSDNVRMSVLDDRVVTHVDNSSIVQQDKKVSVNIFDKTLTIDEFGIKYNGNVDTTLSCLTGIRRDESGDIEVKTQPVDISGNIIVKVYPETDWIKV